MDNNNEIKTVSAPKKNRRVMKSGSYLVVISAIVIAIVIAVNFFASALPQSLTQIDMSEDSMFTVSDEAKEILGTIDENVTVYLICTEGSADTRIKKLLTDMDESSDFITFTEIDPATNPNFVSQYTSDSLSENSIIAVSDKRNTAVPNEDFIRINVDGYGEMSTEEFDALYYQYYYSTGSAPTYTQLFYGEQEIVSAISYVTADEIPALYYTTGHGESELTSKFSGYISTENYLYTNLALVNHDIPDDAEAILINNPTNDFTEDEANALITYVQGGGDVILMTAYSTYSNETHPNLAKLCAAMGLVSADGLVMEGNTSHYYQTPYYLLPLIGATDDSSPASRLESVNIYILLTGAHGILQDESVDGVTVTPILSTTDSAFLRTEVTEEFSAEMQEGDVAGQYMVGAASTNSTSGGRLVWYSSPDLVNDSADSMTGQGNSQLFVANLNWMAGKMESISIIGKDVTVDPITIDESTMGIWRVVFCVIIPVAVVGAGLSVWLRRRRR